MPDETSRRYLFVAMDRATRWVFMRIYGDMPEASSVDFLRRLKLASPIRLSNILTDNGSKFTDHFATKDKKSSGRHAFDVAFAALPAEHRLVPPRHPQTNNMVERFNGHINELLQKTLFDSRADLQVMLMNYLELYNRHISQRAIRSKTSTPALKSSKRNGKAYLSAAFMIKWDSTVNLRPHGVTCTSRQVRVRAQLTSLQVGAQERF